MIKQNQYKIIGLFFGIIGLLGIFHLTMIGRLMTNLFRVVGGDTYVFLGVVCILYGCLIALFNKEIRFKKKKVLLGLILVYLAFIVWTQADFNSKYIKGNDWYLAQKNLWLDIKNNQVDHVVGGGILVGFLTQCLQIVTGQIGIYVIAALLVFLGVVNLFDLERKIKSYKVK